MSRNLEARPERIEAVFDHPARRRELAHGDVGSRNVHFFARACRAVVQPEGAEQQGEVQSEEEDDRPGADHHEHDRMHQAEQPCDQEKHLEPLKAQRAIGGQFGAEHRLFAVRRLIVAIRHDH
ncbi:hypothetical protein D3C72_2174860 [compost metagenome]